MEQMEQLVKIYLEDRDRENIERVNTEMETLEFEFSSARKLAQCQLDEDASVASVVGCPQCVTQVKGIN